MHPIIWHQYFHGNTCSMAVLVCLWCEACHLWYIVAIHNCGVNFSPRAVRSIVTECYDHLRFHLSVQWWTVNLQFITHLMNCLILESFFVTLKVPWLLNCLIEVLHEQQLGKHQGVNSQKCCHVFHEIFSVHNFSTYLPYSFFTFYKSKVIKTMQ